MSQELGYQAYVDQPRVPGRFIAAGVGLVLIGLFCGCGAAATPFSLRLAPAAAVPRRVMILSVVSSLAVLLPLAVGAIWTGIGCFLGRRWVRPVILIFSVYALAFGVPSLFAVVTATTNPTPAAPMPLTMTWIRVIGGAIVFGIYVVLPLGYFLAFRSAETRELLSRLDPKRRWTDRLPVPVLGMAVATFLLGVQLSLGPLLIQRTFLMGNEVPWLYGELALSALALGMLFAAYLLFHEQITGWWLAVEITLLTAVSNYLNLVSFGPEVYQSAMGNVQPNARPLALNLTTMLISQSLWLLTLLAGALWVKRCCLVQGVEFRGTRARIAPTQRANVD